MFVSQTLSSQVPDDKKIRVLNFDQLEPYLNFRNDTVYLVNFWATWCAPCVAELPAIKAVEKKYSDKKFKVLLTKHLILSLKTLTENTFPLAISLMTKVS